MFSDKMSIIIIFFKLVRFVKKYWLAYFPWICYFPLLSECPDDVTEAVYEGLLV